MAQAVVLNQAELRKLESEQPSNVYTEKISLQHVEYYGVFKKDRFQYMLVYTEANVRVDVNSLEIPFPWWTPMTSAKGEMNRLMNDFCKKWVGGNKIKKKKYELVSDEPVKLTRFPTWDVKLNMSFRCQ